MAENGLGPIKTAEALAERLRQLVHDFGGNAAVSRLSDVPLRTLNAYLAGDSEPKFSTLVRLLAACGTDLGSFLGYGDAENSIDSGLDAENSPVVPVGFFPVPRLDIRASAGNGRLANTDALEGGEFVAFREDWMRRIGLRPRFAQALTAIGDSMEPTIRDGDLLLIDRSIDRVIDNGIYVVVVAGMVLVKRIQTRRDGSIVLKSDNERYDPELVPPDEVTDLIVEGRVRWFGRTI